MLPSMFKYPIKFIFNCRGLSRTNTIFRSISINKIILNKNINDIDDIISTEEENREYELIANKCFLYKEQNCFIIHPHIKWGPKKKQDTTAQSELSEAVSLINTLSGWQICNQIIVPVENVDKKTLFGSGTLEKLKQQIRCNRAITTVFINVGTLKNIQITELENSFNVTILDRYKVVMQILRQHAISKHAKLQVALAEIPYLRSRLKYIEIGISNNCRVRDKMLQEREQKLKTALKKLRSHRELLRNKRRTLDFPVVAMVGYTNVGKTSLIKCLTGDKNLEPKNQLFATLDVTMHAGLLPSRIEVLYVDTVGFISDIPTDLIECFIATLEDAMLADVIVHIQDVSNQDMIHQKKHVESVVESLGKKIGGANFFSKIISVGNKADSALKTIIEENKDLILVSAKDMRGIDQLKMKIETVLLKYTGRHTLCLRVPTGGEETRWLFKNATVVDQHQDENDSQFQMLNVVITEAKLKQFDAYFVSKK